MQRRPALSLGLAAMAAVTLALAGCGSGESAPAGDTPGADDGYALIKDGTLTVCSDIPYPPFEFEDPSSELGYSGFDIDLLSAIAAELDLDIAVQVSGFDGLQSGTVLVAGQCDMAASAMTITDKRKANLDFSDPYYDSLQSLLVRADSGITGIGDLDGKNVGVQQGTTGEIYATEHAEGANLTQYPSDGELWPAIQAGQIDAILQDQPVNIEHERADSDYTIVEEYDTDEEYGFAFAKGEKDALREAINKALAQLRDSGEYQKIYDKYFSAE